MPRFAANLSMLFTELPFLDRFDAAAAAGFRGVEYLFPYDVPASEIAERLRANELTQVLFNAPPGDWGVGERGIASLAGRDDEFDRGIDLALAYAKELGNTLIHVMAGVPEDRASDETRELYVSRIRRAADMAARENRTILIEAINPYDMPGYFLGSVAQARELLVEISRPNVELQLDLYHAQITDGDLSRLIRATQDVTAHVQTASVPDRHEPGTGEIDDAFLFDLLDAEGYRGWVGCEYRPADGTETGLGWFTPFRSAR